MRRVRTSGTGPAVLAPEDAPAGSWSSAFGLGRRVAPSDVHAAVDQIRLVIHVAPMLAIAHAAAALAMLWIIYPTAGSAALLILGGTIGIALLADAVLCLAAPIMLARKADPHQIEWLMLAYALLIDIAWSALLLLLPAPEETGRLAVLVATHVGVLIVGALVLSAVPAAALAAVLIPIALAITLAPSVALALAALALAGCIAATLTIRARRARLLFHVQAQAQRDARKASHLLAEFEESGRGWFWETDPKGNLTYISNQLSRAIERPIEDLLGFPFTDLVVNGADDALINQPGERTLGFHLSTRIAFIDVAVRAAVEGETRYWSLSGRPAFDDYGHFLGFRGSGTDLTEMRRSEAEINRLARYDALTGLPNRILMRQTLEASLRDAGGRPKSAALFMLDLDRFKSVNDTLGHPVGDILLRQVAERLLGVVGERGHVGRLGGDEFNVVLPDIDDHSRLAAIAPAIIEKLSLPYMIEGSHVSIGASVGIAIAPNDGATADALVRNADLALYAAKADGKGVHRFYEQEMHASAKDRRLLEVDLRNVLNEGGLSLLYQPVVNATTEAIVGFEALVRWNHPTRGPVSPTAFIPVAEEIGLIPQIGEWVLRTACLEAAKWPGNIRVAVNISPIQFANPALPGIVMSALAASQLPADRLELEITEGVFLNDGVATDEMFARLKAIGVRFALDDFGTGYSSLGYLKKAPFNKIKIDQSFVRGASIPGSRNGAIMRAIVTLAESLDMETTAEGAETHDELALIRSLGCSHVQGYIFGKPMAPAEAIARVSDGGTLVADGFLASRSPRVAVLRSAMLHLDGKTIAARIRNISVKGAMVETAKPPAPATRVEIEFADGGRHAGAVRWAQEGRFGMTFDGNFDIDQLNAPRPIVMPRSLRAG